MSEEHPIFKLLQVEKKDLTKEKVEEILLQYSNRLSEAMKKTRILPVGLVDMDTLAQVIMEVVQGYQRTMMHLVQQTNLDADKKWQVTEIVEQANIEIKSFLEQILGLLKKLGENVDLEREVLVKLNARLGRGV